MHMPSVNFALRRRTFEEGKVYHEVGFYENDLEEEEYYHPDNIEYCSLVMCLNADNPRMFMDVITGEIFEPHMGLYYYEVDKV